MGRIRGSTIKIAARKIVALYFSRIGFDFDTNLAVVRDVASIQNKKLRNQVAGYVTHLYTRIQTEGTVKGINIKSHEEDKEKRENFIPKVGVLDAESVPVDHITQRMIEKYQIGGNFIVMGTTHTYVNKRTNRE